MSVASRISKPAALARPLRDELFGLFCSCFDNTSRHRFDRDLDAKDWIILLQDAERIVGFTTASFEQLELCGTTMRCLFSGDTLVLPQYWGRPALPAAFGHLMLELVGRSDVPLYWFLVSKGFRTYRLLTSNFIHFVPDCRRPPDAHLSLLLEKLADRRFGDRFDAATGIVRARDDGEFLKPAFQDVAPGRFRDPQVRYFLERNPGWRRGDELACLAPCTRSNLTRVARRQLASGSPTWAVP